jgi:hypothetical protein
MSTSPERSSGGNLHCTLFLFNDKLLIVKRQNAGVSGLEVTGFEDIEGLLSSGGGWAGLTGAKQLRKDKLSAKGMVDILEVIASDVGDSGALQCVLTHGALCTDSLIARRFPSIHRKTSTRPRGKVVSETLPPPRSGEARRSIFLRPLQKSSR